MVQSRATSFQGTRSSLSVAEKAKRESAFHGANEHQSDEPSRGDRCANWWTMARINHIVFIKPMGVAIIPTIISVAMKWYYIENKDSLAHGIFPEESLAYSSLSWVLGFVLVFRTGQAYNRYWDAARSLHQMTVELLDACAQMIAFAESSNASRKKIDAFRLSVVRLFSLFHGVALQQITDVEDEDIQIIDPTGLDIDHVQYMRTYPRKIRPDIVMQWIIRTMTMAMKNGVVDTPPPIVSRAYQECNSGLVALSQMRVIAELPFPVPYAKMVWILLGVHMFITPFYVVSFTNARFWAGMYAFTSTFSLWCIQYIAMELEQPFGDGVNNLDLGAAQEEMNDSLLILLDNKSQWTPNLEEVAAKAGNSSDLSTRRISHAERSGGSFSSMGSDNSNAMKKTSSIGAVVRNSKKDPTPLALSASTSEKLYSMEEGECFSLPSSNKNSRNSLSKDALPPAADFKSSPVPKLPSVDEIQLEAGEAGGSLQTSPTTTGEPSTGTGEDHNIPGQHGGLGQSEPHTEQEADNVGPLLGGEGVRWDGDGSENRNRQGDLIEGQPAVQEVEDAGVSLRMVETNSPPHHIKNSECGCAWLPSGLWGSTKEKSHPLN